jgi:hypothetical protein
MLLLHEFMAKKYLCPDKKAPTAKDLKKGFFGEEEVAETGKGN